MKKNVSLIAIITVMMAFAINLYAASPTEITKTADAKARIISPLQLDLTSGILNFGDLAVGAAGTCSIDGLKVRTVTGGVTLAGTVSDVPQFKVTGQDGVKYKISSLPLNAADIILSDGATHTMTAHIHANLAGTAATAPTYTLTGTIESFTISGTLDVAANQTPGTYTTTFNVTVDYE